MKAKTMCATAVAMTILVFSMLSVTVNAGENGNQKDKPDAMGFELNQNIAFGEVVGGAYGIYPGGTLFPLGPFVNETTGKALMAYGEPVAAVANWSDDIVLHQYKAGAKIRTEVILWDPAKLASTYTIRASFKIEQIDAVTGDVLRLVWDGTTAEGLWVDGPTDAYSAEINQLGQLLYGYNWDTKLLKCVPGEYRLTFSVDAVLPNNVPAEYVPVDAQPITIIGTDDVTSEFSTVGFTSSSTFVELTLLPAGGR